MDSRLRAQVVFHLTGRQPGAGETEAEISGPRPALLAPYRDLESLRHDFPVVLCDRGDEFVRSLSSVVDHVLRSLAPPGAAGEGMRRRVLALEKEIRRQVAAGAQGTLSGLWDAATGALAAQRDEAFLRDVSRAREALPVDGALAGCGASLPAKFLHHGWSVVQREKARAARSRIDRLVIRLGEILRADYRRSEEALQKPALQASFGAAHHALFDFGAMSKLLQRAGRAGGLDERRRGRIESARRVLLSQRFFPALDPADVGAESGSGHRFSFDTPAEALSAFRERLPELVELLKAIQVAELEVEGSYLEELHDPIFGALDPQAVSAEDLQFFPDYLVCLISGAQGEAARLAEALSSGVPLKILVQVDDLFEESAPGQGHFAFGLPSARLASTAMSFDDVFVLQSAASNLVQLKTRVIKGLTQAGTALFCVYAGPGDGMLPGYLAAAAAMQSRAFPAFSYDPAAGADLASRFSLENNPQPERDWPVETLRYAGSDLQAATEDVAFTFVDFALCDSRCARHFSRVPRAAWGETMVPLAEWLEHPPRDAASGVPYVLAVDEADLLCRLVVDERLVRSALRRREGWHRLQELAGIHDSRAERLLAREREAWEAEHRRGLTQAAGASPAPDAGAGGPPAAVADQPSAAPGAEVVEPERNPDEPYIETIRCSTCNECTQVNPRMFAYDANKQAYIADLKAGTYAQMVEAAESCQLSIIHPGKPWDVSEPGLEELVARAQPFL
jgi:ferredoxin